jgi:acyl-CoA reductase-like NAD-dependent aldehyde dehydrogenase
MKVRRHIDDARDKGARLLIGGGAGDNGHFAEPTVLAGASAGMQLAGEETFGPVAPLFHFKDEQEAIEIANATAYGSCLLLFHAKPEPGLARGRTAGIRHRVISGDQVVPYRWAWLRA